MYNLKKLSLIKATGWLRRSSTDNKKWIDKEIEITNWNKLNINKFFIIINFALSWVSTECLEHICSKILKLGHPSHQRVKLDLQ